MSEEDEGTGTRNLGELYREYLEETFAGRRCHCWMSHRGYRGDSVLERDFWHNFLKTEKSWHGSVDQLHIGRYRVDVAIDCDGKSVVVELDGAAYHDTEADKVRDLDLLDSVDAIIRIPYAPLNYYRFSTFYVLEQWYPRLSIGEYVFTLTEDEFRQEIEDVENNGEYILSEWLEWVEPDYDIVGMRGDHAVIRSPKGFLNAWNVRPITIQYGNGRPEVINRIYEKSGCKRIDG